MTYLEIGAGFALGFFVGIGAALFYLRWQMKRQIGDIEEQMGAMMDMSEEMSDMMEPDEMMPEMESGEEADGEEKEEK